MLLPADRATLEADSRSGSGHRLGRSKVVVLAVFSSDAISSTAHGTEQVMLVLVGAGAVATGSKP